MMKYLQFIQIFFIIIVIKGALHRGWAFFMGASRVLIRSLKTSYLPVVFRPLELPLFCAGYLPTIVIRLKTTG
jgi:hypothetical protein